MKMPHVTNSRMCPFTKGDFHGKNDSSQVLRAEARY